MKHIIQVSPDGKYDIVPSRYISGLKSSTYPSILDNVAIVGKHKIKEFKAPNYYATCLIDRNIIAVLDGYAFLFKSNCGLSNLGAFTKEEAEEIVKSCIERIGGETR